MAWTGFKGEKWKKEIDVRDFIQQNYKPYEKDGSFLVPPTERTIDINNKYIELAKKERENGGVLSIDTSVPSSILSYKPGYLDRENELIYGLQTEKPLERSVNPFGGLRLAQKACEAYGYTLDEKVLENFRYKTTHNDGVFSVYTPEMRKARSSGVITGLPDAYGRGRLIGDYRRVALYGIDFLVAKKQEDKLSLGKMDMDVENIRLLEELAKQIDFLQKLKEMAAGYGDDISHPARNSREAVQWLYYAYLGAIKEQNGAAMSLGRVSTFLDIYFQRDLEQGKITEEKVQELIDDFVIKLRMARQLRTPEYNELFAGDPTWVTESVGGMGEDGRTLVTKTSFRILHTLYNLGPAPEPNLTVLWSDRLPKAFKEFCAKVSIDTDSIQYENDDAMRPVYGDDYAIACCVSAAAVGKQMQYFGARCNIAKVLLMSLNGGVDEVSGDRVGPDFGAYEGDVLEYDVVMEKFKKYIAWVSKLYVNTMNIIHRMHDKYAYEKLQMALHDTHVKRFMSFGMAGLSVCVDSLSAIKYAKVKPIRDERGIITDFEVEGDFPKYGNDDERIDSIAVWLVEHFIGELKKTPTYRNAEHTLSILTITSNVVYGKKTGSTPDGRKKGEPFAPGANPMHGRDSEGALASLNSVAKIPYEACRDGISCTFSITPQTIGKTDEERIKNLVNILDGYFAQGAHHLNVNVLDRKTLIYAMENPGALPFLTIRVSGYAVNFNALSRSQQQEVISRTFHERL